MGSMRQDIIWIVSTHTGDGHHVFTDAAKMLAYVHSLCGKPCTITAVDPAGNKLMTTDCEDRR